MVSRLSYFLLPQEPGVYLFLDENRNVIYVGKAVNLKNRVSSYFKNKDLGTKTSILVSRIKKIKVIVVSSEIESLLLEANLIKKYQPFFNVKMTDGKSYPMIKITMKDKCPAVIVTRRIIDDKSLYFGPYPNARAMHLVLKIIRRIFPFQSIVNHPKKICLYNHLGLCPCLSAFDLEDSRKEYRKTIKNIIRFLKGNIKGVIKDLERERESFDKKENYEKAKEIQEKIESIKIVTSSIHSPLDYEINPNLITDLQEKKMIFLKEALNKNGVKTSSIKRIECYDISNISGKYATGSMVVFENAKKEMGAYRKFKIKQNFQKQNDCAMMKEVVSRRLKHREWQYPDLIIVDGGKGQISSVVNVVKENNLVIPVVGLAKREEILITSAFKKVNFNKNSEALKLLMEIRDEAHRFAVFYHRKLRSKFSFS
ncbi:MAG: excinuclease ABC subunit UvrC [bacterium]|nr:excinuclease ABC subunit UvrC [bacterium]